MGIGFDKDKDAFAQLVKVFGKDEKGFDTDVRADKVPRRGNPNLAKINTSYVERQNLTPENVAAPVCPPHERPQQEN